MLHQVTYNVHSFPFCVYLLVKWTIINVRTFWRRSKVYRWGWLSGWVGGWTGRLRWLAEWLAEWLVEWLVVIRFREGKQTRKGAAALAHDGAASTPGKYVLQAAPHPRTIRTRVCQVCNFDGGGAVESKYTDACQSYERASRIVAPRPSTWRGNFQTKCGITEIMTLMK